MGAQGINVGSVFDWAFSPDRRAFSKINSLGLHQLDLTQIDASGRPKTLWKTTSLSNASQVVAVGELLLVQNTSGVLACLDPSSGQEVWRGAAVGEGAHPVALASGDILQTTWAGDVVRRSAKTGEVLRTTSISDMIDSIVPLGRGGGWSAITVDRARKNTAYVTNLRRFDGEALYFSEPLVRRNLAEFSVSPCSRYLAINRLVDDPELERATRFRIVEIVSLDSLETLCSREMTPDTSPLGPIVWEPGCRWISYKSCGAGPVRLDRATLGDLSPLGRTPQNVLGFSPDGALILLEGSKTTLRPFERM